MAKKPSGKKKGAKKGPKSFLVLLVVNSLRWKGGETVAKKPSGKKKGAKKGPKKLV